MLGLGDWVRNLVVLVFVISAAQLLLPANSMRPYVRFVLGLVVLSALMASVFRLSVDEIGLERILFPGGEEHSAAPYIERGRAIAASVQGSLVEQDASRVESQVTSVATIVLGFEPEQVLVVRREGGQIERIAIFAPSDPDPASARDGGPAGARLSPTDAGRAARTVAGLLGLDTSQIEIYDNGSVSGGESW